MRRSAGRSRRVRTDRRVPPRAGVVEYRTGQPGRSGERSGGSPTEQWSTWPQPERLALERGDPRRRAAVPAETGRRSRSTGTPAYRIAHRPELGAWNGGRARSIGCGRRRSSIVLLADEPDEELETSRRVNEAAFLERNVGVQEARRFMDVAIGSGNRSRTRARGPSRAPRGRRTSAALNTTTAPAGRAVGAVVVRASANDPPVRLSVDEDLRPASVLSLSIRMMRSFR